MPNITLCPGGECPLRGNCYRHLTFGSRLWQSYFAEPPYEDEDCDYYIPEKKDWPKGE